MVTFTYHADDGIVGSNVATVTIAVIKRTRIYLPLVFKNHVVAPDLVVRQIVATSNDVQVVIENQGNGPVVDDFWVDVYVNPDPAPTAVNQIWPDLADEGLAWGITTALAPGDVLTLTASGALTEYSAVSWPLAAGALVYAQVDSWNEGVSYGAVLEDHEIQGEAYNNVAGPVVSTGLGSGEAAEPTATGGGRPRRSGNLPPRP